MVKAAVTTLGCKVNQYETETIIRDFESLGVEVVDFNQPADIYIINTCTVTQVSDHKSRQLIRKAIRRHPKSLTVVTGCYVDRAREEIVDIKGVDLVIPNNQKPQLASLVQREVNSSDMFISRKRKLSEGEIQVGSLLLDRDSGRQTWRQKRHTRALVKVEDGCDKYCSFCIVPYVRGKPVSRSVEDVVGEVKGLIKEGAKEIVLTGVNLGQYLSHSNSSEVDLTGLLEILLHLPELGRLRLSSIEVGDLTPSLIHLMQSHHKLCRHLHIPLQSGDSKVLKRMNRSYTGEEYLKVVREIKKKIPSVAITTDVMVGFPGEEEASFTHTLRLVREIAFRKIHVFKYSPREGTLAASLKNQVSPEVKEHRSKRLVRLGEGLSQRFIDAFRGKRLEVVVEKEVDKGLLKGLSDNYIRVYFEGPSWLKGSLVKVRALKSERDGLYGRLERREDGSI